MTNEQINEAIAAACGWTDFVVHPEFGLMGTPPGTHGLRTAVDYYTVDLNAMNEAEATLNTEQLNNMRWLLQIACDSGKYADLSPAYWRAPASLRAKAFLQTVAKWKEKEAFKS